ncbi:MAG TPA: class II glutamine amidotransferase, partial [Pirellulales bacterium]|nr:class II glutamine amidotransferase [Pirellulales bacterium]
MCGIVGYVGTQSCQSFLVQGLRRLEYRGYDSAGVATITSQGRFAIVKAAGRIDRLGELLARRPAEGTIGIGHTRWATHGAANDDNAHPHVGGNDVVAIAHNGVIENYRPLKEWLETQGYRFRSATDSEVIAHLLASCLEKEQASAAGRDGNGHSGESISGLSAEHAMLVRAVRAALARLQGTYGLAILFRQYPGVLIGARLGSPLVVGVNDNEHFLASDASPL